MVSGGGKVLEFIGKLSGGMSGAAGAGTALGTGTEAAAGGIAGIATPAAIAVAAVGLLTGAFITAYNNDDAFAKKVDEDWANIKQSITDIINTIKPVVELAPKAEEPAKVDSTKTE